MAHVGNGGDEASARLQEGRQTPHHLPGVDQVLQHVEAENDVQGARLDLLIESQGLDIANPKLIEPLARLARRLLAQFDPGEPELPACLMALAQGR